jgi:hypothetical protein
MLLSNTIVLVVAASLFGENASFQNMGLVKGFPRSTVMMLQNSNRENTDLSNSRRRFLGGVVAGAGTWLVGNAAEAKDELFKANPLTNSVLEQVCTRCYAALRSWIL